MKKVGRRMKKVGRRMKRFETRFDLPTDDHSVPDMNLSNNETEEVETSEGATAAPSVVPGEVGLMSSLDINRKELGELEFLLKQGNMFIMENIGSGGFGSVYKCFNKKSKSTVAVKYFNASPHIKEYFDREVDTMFKISEHGVSGVVEMKHSMQSRNVHCIVYELLGITLFKYLDNKIRGLPLTVVQNLMRQLFEALKQLHNIGIVHADLKPANIAFVGDSSSLKIKILDFGSAINLGQTYAWDEHQTRYYRCPEACLRLEIDTSSDMWSLGCILGQLVSNEIMFPGECNEYQLQLYCVLLGPPPNRLLEKSRKTKAFFNYLPVNGDISSTDPPFFRTDYNLEHRKEKLPSLESVLKHSILEKKNEEHLHNQFMELLKSLLQMDPEKRITAEAALEIPFIKDANITMSLH